MREPGIFWHNIARPGSPRQFLVSHGQIPACFENAPGDAGERILTKYVPGDVVVAYAKGFGAIGWGIIERPNTYRLVAVGEQDDALQGDCRHRLSIRWNATAHELSQGMPAEEVRREFDIYHPISTSVAIDREDGKRLLERLTGRFDGDRSTTSGPA